MQIGEAVVKVMEEMSNTLIRAAGVESVDQVRDMPSEELIALARNDDVEFKKYLYGGAAKDFIGTRGKKRAEAIIEKMVSEGIDFRADPDTLTMLLVRNVDEAMDSWHQDMLHMFAMAYSFAAPDLNVTEYDKETFLRLCREVDRDLIAIQVTQFSVDQTLREIVEQRVHIAAEFTSQMFSQVRRPITKFAFRDWFYQVWSTVALNCFIAGHKVRDLLEEEAAFEAMMKEID